MKKSITTCRDSSANLTQAVSPMKNFVSLGTIGHGAFSQVHKVRRVSDGKIYALKKIKLHSLKPKQQQYAISEIKILAALSCPYIISFRQSFYDGEAEQLCIVMEWANEGDLHSDVQKRKKSVAQSNKNAQNSGLYSKPSCDKNEGTPQSQVWRAVRDILSGLAVLHEASILHRDIKSANIFKSEGVYKLGDLNIAKICPGLAYAYTQTGTPYYASPQVWKQLPYNTKSDIWSFGCVIYEMCELSPPFMGADMKDLYQLIIRGRYKPIRSQYSKQLADLISLCLKVDPKQRKSCQQLLHLPWIQQKLIQHHIAPLNHEHTSVKQSAVSRPAQLPFGNTNNKSISNTACHYQQQQQAYPKQLSIKLTKQLRELRSITEPTNEIQLGSYHHIQQQQKSIELGKNGSCNNSLVYRYGPDKLNELLPQANYPSQAKRNKKISQINTNSSIQPNKIQIVGNKNSQQDQPKLSNKTMTGNQQSRQAKYISSIPLSQSMQSETILKINASDHQLNVQNKEKQANYNINGNSGQQKDRSMAKQLQHNSAQADANSANKQAPCSDKSEHILNDLNNNNNNSNNRQSSSSHRISRKLINNSYGPLTILKSSSRKLRPPSPAAYVIQNGNGSKRKLIRPLRSQNSKGQLRNINSSTTDNENNCKGDISNKLTPCDNQKPPSLIAVSTAVTGKQDQQHRSTGRQANRSVTLVQSTSQQYKHKAEVGSPSKITRTQANQHESILDMCRKYKSKQEYQGRPYLNKGYANNYQPLISNNNNSNGNVDSKGYIVNGRRRPYSSSQPRTIPRYDGYIHRVNSGRVNSAQHHSNCNRVVSSSLIQPSYSSNKVLKNINTNQMHPIAYNNNNNSNSNSNHKLAGLIYNPSQNNNNNKCTSNPYMPMPGYYKPKAENVPNYNHNNNGYIDSRHGREQPMQDLPRIRQMLVNRSSNVRQQIGKLYYNYSQYTHKDTYNQKSRHINRSRGNLL